MKAIILNETNTKVRLERYAKRLPSEEEILDFEQSLRYSLPIDYKEFLLAYNGGVCELKNVIMPISGYLCDLFGLYPDDYETNLMTLKLPNDPELIELWGELPSNLLPIGEVDSGDMIAIEFGNGTSKIIVVDHEGGGVEGIASASTFTEFLVNTIKE